MTNYEHDVTIEIEELGPDGQTVPISWGKKGINPGKSKSLKVINENVSIDLVSAVGDETTEAEIVVIAFYDVESHAMVTHNTSVTYSHENHLHEKPEHPDPILAHLLDQRDSVTLYARTEIPGLKLAHPEIVGYRFTRI